MPANLKPALPAFIVAGLTFLIADPAQAVIDNSNVLDNILNRYETAAAAWAAVITDAASWLFWTLVLISMVMTFGFMAMRQADLGEFFAEFLRFTLFTGLFWWLLINGPDFATSIFVSLQQLAGNATGMGPAMSPSGIVDIGFSIFNKALAKLTAWSPVQSMAGLIMSGIILICLALISVNMLLLLCAAWILAYGAVFLLGFGGSRWTSDIAINYYKTVLGVGLQLLTMVLLVGIGRTFVEDYFSRMTTGGVELREMGVMVVVAIVLLVLTDKIPALVAGIVTGTSIGNNLGIGTFGAGAAFGAASMAGTAVAASQAAVSTGMENAAGGAQALIAACTKAGRNVQDETDVIASVFGKYGSPQNGNDDAQGSGGAPRPPLDPAKAEVDALAATSEKVDAFYAKQAADRKAESGARITKPYMPGEKTARFLADAGANLVAGASAVAGEKAGEKLSDMKERVADTTGGKIAEAIKSQETSQKAGSLEGAVSAAQKAESEKQVADTAGGKIAEAIKSQETSQKAETNQETGLPEGNEKGSESGRLAMIGFSATLALALFSAAPAVPARPSQDECAIWLCATVGFAVEGCRGPHKAMLKRIRKFKSPIPSFSSCAEKGSIQMDSKHGIAAFVPGSPNKYVRGRRCKDVIGEAGGIVGKEPPGCTSTVRWAEVFVEGEQAGETYYWSDSD